MIILPSIILPTDRLQRTSCTFAPFSISSFSNRALGTAASGKVGLRRPMRGAYDTTQVPNYLRLVQTTRQKHYCKIYLNESLSLNNMIMCKKLKLLYVVHSNYFHDNCVCFITRKPTVPRRNYFKYDSIKRSKSV